MAKSWAAYFSLDDIILFILGLTFFLVMISFSTQSIESEITKFMIVASGSLLAGLLALGSPLQRQRLTRLSVYHLPFVFFFTLQLLSLAYSHYPVLSYDFLIIIVPLMVYFYLISTREMSSREMRFCLALVYLVSFITGCYGLLQYLDLDVFPWSGFEGRIFSTFGHPNFFATWLMFSLPVILLTVLSNTNRWVRGSGSVILFIVLFNLLLTRCRSAWLSLLIVFLPFLFCRRSYDVIRRSVFNIAIISLMVVIAVTVISTHADIVHRLHSILDPDDPSVKSRFLIYQSLWPAVVENPVLGWGAGTFSAIFPLYHPEELYLVPPFTTMTMLKHAHSEYLEILLDNGLLGLLLFGCCAGVLVLFMVRTGRREAGPDYCTVLGIFLGLAALLIQNFVSVSFRFTTTQTIFWSGAALIMARYYTHHGPERGYFLIQRKVQTIFFLAFYSLLLMLIGCYSLPHVIQRYQTGLFLKEIKGLLDQGKYEQAAIPLQQALDKAPLSIDVLNAAGAQALHMKNFDESSQYFERILEINPSFPMVHYHLALNRFYQKDLHGTLQFLTEATKRRPNSWPIQELFGQVSMLEGNLDLARSYFYKAIEIDPAQATPYFYLGNSALMVGNFEQALIYYNQSLSRNPDQLVVWLRVSQANQRVRQTIRQRKLKEKDKPMLDDPLPSRSHYCLEQGLFDTISPGLNKIKQLSQSFIAPCAALSSFSVHVATRYQTLSATMVFKLYRQNGTDQELLRQVRRNFDHIIDDQWLTFEFERIDEARDQQYVATLSVEPSSAENNIHLWLKLKDLYGLGQMSIEQLKVGSDLQFRLD